MYWLRRLFFRNISTTDSTWRVTPDKCSVSSVPLLLTFIHAEPELAHWHSASVSQSLLQAACWLTYMCIALRLIGKYNWYLKLKRVKWTNITNCLWVAIHQKNNLPNAPARQLPGVNKCLYINVKHMGGGKRVFSQRDLSLCEIFMVWWVHNTPAGSKMLTWSLPKNIKHYSLLPNPLNLLLSVLG